MRRSLLSWFLLLVAFPVSAQSARAEGEPPLGVGVRNLSAVADSVAGSLRSNDLARPGDRLRYTLSFANPAPRPITGVRLENRVPAGLAYVAGSARSSRSAQVSFSVDGGRSFAERPVAPCPEEPARSCPVSPELYTHVRWVVRSLPLGADVSASFEARILDSGR